MVLILLLSHIAGDISYLLQHILSWTPGILSKLNIKAINLLIRVIWIVKSQRNVFRGCDRHREHLHVVMKY
jgi:hypothetical protein